MKATGDEPLDVVNSGAEDWVGVSAADHEAAIRRQLALIVRALEDHAPPTTERPGCTYCQGALASAKIVAEKTDALVGLLQQAERERDSAREAAEEYLGSAAKLNDDWIRHNKLVAEKAEAAVARAERAEQRFTSLHGEWLRLTAANEESVARAERAEQDSLNANEEIEDLWQKKKAALAHVRVLEEALRPFAEYHVWKMAKGMKAAPPPLGPKELEAAARALAVAAAPPEPSTPAPGTWIGGAAAAPPEPRCTGYCVGTAKAETLVEDLTCPVHGIEAQKVAETRFEDRQAWLDSLTSPAAAPPSETP